MVHIASTDLMEMYPILTESKIETTCTIYDKSKERIGEQVLVNYAFGHPESSLVPLGTQVTLINHGGKQANAFIAWNGEKGDVIENGHSYLYNSVEELSGVAEIVFDMKIVALADIKEGAEITLNYGDSWQEAWDEYVAWFSKRIKKDQNIRSRQMT
ncbi:hypothetical protein IV203_018160 [Nitzschia inconspicua]|uniref:SET domain-containing protein n=1 Tax=Nitzschia inconspicua TaxID=303405 RepID=A0A9K3M184_9STRA|nr:hypothetical protein IV203_018160 [Nitzschia inconspicua]